MTLVSIVTAAYNSEKTIGRMIESVLNQSHSQLELIIVDDGSKDSTHKIIETYKQVDSRVKYYFQFNQGVSVARNLGIKKSKGKFICFVDSDDYIHEDLLTEMIDSVLKSKSQLAISNINSEGSNDSYLINMSLEKTLSEIIENGNIKGYIGNKVFLSEIIKKNHIYFDEKIGYSEDMDFIVRYILTDDFKKSVYLPKRFYYYIENKDSVTNNFILVNRLQGINSVQKIISNLKEKKIALKIINIYVDYYYRFLIYTMTLGYYYGYLSRIEVKEYMKKFEIDFPIENNKTIIRFYLLYYFTTPYVNLYVRWRKLKNE